MDSFLVKVDEVFVGLQQDTVALALPKLKALMPENDEVFTVG